MYEVLGQSDRNTANRLAYASLRDLTVDRVEVLAEEYADTMLRHRILPAGVELVRRARKQGHKVVLLSESIGPVVRPLARELGRHDELICNELEFRNDRATGRLVEPIIGGHDVARWVADYAAEHDLDLARSVAYGTRGPDLLLLSAVGEPCAVNPDYSLRRAAEGASWPVMDYAA